MRTMFVYVILHHKKLEKYKHNCSIFLNIAFDCFDKSGTLNITFKYSCHISEYSVSTERRRHRQNP